ncbi:hypothetical protein AVEN_15667-1 [Araneus ventricosus]|uniref:Uncharacterized protein n=1 Tax=Araneus ventricosus TaxID=182803 RepID=A0A4Y2K499_ARAVE|nr:hypothetical protein AVEN_15667-1 [Araneus ventricosus]
MPKRPSSSETFRIPSIISIRLSKRILKLAALALSFLPTFSKQVSADPFLASAGLDEDRGVRGSLPPAWLLLFLLVLWVSPDLQEAASSGFVFIGDWLIKCCRACDRFFVGKLLGCVTPEPPAALVWVRFGNFNFYEVAMAI